VKIIMLKTIKLHRTLNHAFAKNFNILATSSLNVQYNYLFGSIIIFRPNK